LKAPNTKHQAPRKKVKTAKHAKGRNLNGDTVPRESPQKEESAARWELPILSLQGEGFARGN
jgi:hypothetical protein